jgi:hypothetical protein
MGIINDLDRDYAEAWRPDPGEVLAGAITEITSRDGGYGEYPILVVRQGAPMETELAFHAIHTVAQSELASKKPQIGETIAIKYLGKREAASGKTTYDGYKVVIDRDAGEFDWSRYGDRRADEGMPRADAEVNRERGAAIPGCDDLPF